MRYLILFLLLASTAFAQFTDDIEVTTGSLTVSRSTYAGITATLISATTSDAGNVVATGIAINGEIHRIVIKNDSAASPDNLYDVTLTDRDGADILTGDLGNLSDTTATTITKLPMVGDGSTSFTVVTSGQHRFSLSNGGASKTTQIRIITK